MFIQRQLPRTSRLIVSVGPSMTFLVGRPSDSAQRWRWNPVLFHRSHPMIALEG
jgi:hypothetical protein